MAVFLAPIINSQIENSNGAPLSGGTIEVYLAGSSTPSTTYSDKAGVVPNTWPIVLNTLGVNNQGAVWITGGAAYKYVVKDSTGVVQRTIDNVSGINDSTITNDQWILYQGTPTYVSATSFTVAGDQTQTFQIGRRIKTTNTGGTVYSTITNSVYGAPNTTITVSNDSGVLDAGLSAVSYGLLSVQQNSIPGGLPTYGQCRLTKSGANLLLSPLNGNKITVNGQICTIPSAGVSLAPTALTPSTLYYIYAYIGASGLTLEASATGHSTDTTTGVEIKTGDATRTLVGMARPITGPAWQDTAAQRFVTSWFNRQLINLAGVFAANQTYASATFGEPSATIRAEFIAWANTIINSNVSGWVSNSTAGQGAFTIASLQGAVTDGGTLWVSPAVSAIGPVATQAPLSIGSSDNYSYITLLSATTGSGTATYPGSGVTGNRTTLFGTFTG